MLFHKTLSALTSLLVFAGVATAFHGRATWFHDGLGNCGFVNKDSDHIVALSTREYGNGERCNKKIRIHYGSNSIIATVTDSCPSCGRYSIDLSLSSFKTLAPLNIGVVNVVWEYLP
ncbi:RlpA-like double-psi beta-barrel-protein domain-containing protein-containing protein [Crassisporium funariophilum]|nr:RlpA-like double-psi beta-barrel-protein domain-containing protein-containing protein [Crassisporium funariophilum]